MSPSDGDSGGGDDLGVAATAAAHPGLAETGAADPGLAETGAADPGLAETGAVDVGLAGTATDAGAANAALNVELADTLAPSGDQVVERGPLARGTNIGRFVVLDPLGEGGMGSVVTAYDPSLDRKVALKVLRPDRAHLIDLDQATARMTREAQAAARLAHPNVVAVYEVGRYGDGVFIAMEYVEGGTLTAWLESEPRSWDEIVDIFAQAGRGLIAAHDAGLIHRDFKPANVLVDAEGRARVTDFGLVRASEGWQELEPASIVSPAHPAMDHSLTRDGAIMGTVAYMAPEQFLAGDTDARTDQFAFCVALYEAVYGNAPFVGDTFESRMAAVTGGQLRARPTNSDAPDWLYSTIARGLSAEADDRFADMDALLRAFPRQRAGDQQARRVVRTHAALALGAILLVLLVHLMPVGAGRPVAIRSAPTTGYLQLVAHPWAVVWIDGKRVATTPVAELQQLPTGRHTVRFEHDQFEPIERVVFIEDGPPDSPERVMVDFFGEGRQR